MGYNLGFPQKKKMSKQSFPTFRRWMLAHNKAWFSPAIINPRANNDLENKMNFHNCVKAFDLRYWYISTGLSAKKSLAYTHDIENLHNELNYLHAKMFTKRMLLFILASYWFLGQFETEEENQDWGGKFDEKFRLQMYSELDEGGLEGDE